MFALTIVAFALFVVLERRQRLPMLDLSLFRNTTFTGANVAISLVSLAMFGVLFYNSLFIQNVLCYSAIQTGGIFLPMTLLIVLIAPQAGRLTDRVGARWLIGAGMTLVSVSLVLFAQIGTGGTFWNFLPALIAGGTGMALTMTPTTAAAMGSVPTDKAGVGSAVLNAFRQVGGSLGIALMGAIVAAQVSVGPRNPLFADQFTTGYHHALYAAAGISLVGAGIAVGLVRKIRHPEAAVVPESVAA
jgi:MFS family permease